MSSGTILFSLNIYQVLYNSSWINFFKMKIENKLKKKKIHKTKQNKKQYRSSFNVFFPLLPGKEKHMKNNGYCLL
jgi:hypothetical protein